MNKLLKHAKEELKYAGFNIEAPDKEKFDSDDDYNNACAKSAYKLLETFCEEEHSGLSAQITLSLFDKLVRWQNLTPLSNNPDEWLDISEYEGKPEGSSFQSKRCSSCFSNDGLKTYYDLDENENSRIFHELKSRKER